MSDVFCRNDWLKQFVAKELKYSRVEFKQFKHRKSSCCIFTAFLHQSPQHHHHHVLYHLIRVHILALYKIPGFLMSLFDPVLKFNPTFLSPFRSLSPPSTLPPFQFQWEKVKVVCSGTCAVCVVRDPTTPVLALGDERGAETLELYAPRSSKTGIQGIRHCWVQINSHMCTHPCAHTHTHSWIHAVSHMNRLFDSSPFKF